MALADDLKIEATQIFATRWETTKGRVVPAVGDVGLANKAVELDSATVLYADLDGSTAMVDNYLWGFSAEVYKAYLHCAAKIIKDHGGTITAYDGDRIMAVFIGNSKNTNATYAALRINHAVHHILNPAINAQYASNTFVIKHKIGIDTSPLRAARIGVRGDNDLVWVGRAANYAAKLTSISDDIPIWITADVFNALSDPPKNYQGKAAFTARTWTQMGNMSIYCSAWTWTI
jgi:class 3 adenylate cyclase